MRAITDLEGHCITTERVSEREREQMNFCTFYTLPPCLALELGVRVRVRVLV